MESKITSTIREAIHTTPQPFVKILDYVKTHVNITKDSDEIDKEEFFRTGTEVMKNTTVNIGKRRYNGKHVDHFKLVPNTGWRCGCQNWECGDYWCEARFDWKCKQCGWHKYNAGETMCFRCDSSK